MHLIDRRQRMANGTIKIFMYDKKNPLVYKVKSPGDWGLEHGFLHVRVIEGDREYWLWLNERSIEQFSIEYEN